MLIAAPRWAGCLAAATALLGLTALWTPAVAAVPASPATQKLTVALAPEMDSAKLDASTAGAAGGKVTLTLPANLLTSVRSEANKTGLGRAAARVDVSAHLTGAGYDITPNGEQTSKLSDGQALVFTWQVKATGSARSPLTVDVKGGLDGQGAGEDFALGLLSTTPPAPVFASAAPAPGGKLSLMDRLSFRHLHAPDLRKLKLPDLNGFSLQQLQIPGHRTVSLPGLGAVPSQKVVTGAILILVVLALMIIARNASARRKRAERRRRFRTFEATTFGDEPDQSA